MPQVADKDAPPGPGEPAKAEAPMRDRDAIRQHGLFELLEHSNEARIIAKTVIVGIGLDPTALAAPPAKLVRTVAAIRDQKQAAGA